MAKKIKPSFTVLLLGSVVIFAGVFFIPFSGRAPSRESITQKYEIIEQEAGVQAKEFVIPEAVRAIYVASPATLEARFEEFVALIEETELNSVVVTMKSGGGMYKDEGVADLVFRLKERGIHPIVRLAVFQDNALARSRPDLALKSGGGGLWRDGAGGYWMDPASKEVWDYNLAISKTMIDFGFTEINFDYIRFPSDGMLSDIRYPVWSGREARTDIIKEFFAYLTGELKEYNQDAVLSADIFGYVLLSHVANGGGIGQRVEDATRYFDVVAPMVYPSHYSAGNFGFENPAVHPYEVILGTLEQGNAKLDVSEGVKGVMRPWLQAFNMGAVYDARMVNLEKQAVYDAGLSSWMLWNPRSVYSKDLFTVP